MADRPKKKQTHGLRNDERPNGKAPKKRPKLPKTLSPEQRAERDRLAAERRVYLKERADKEAREIAKRKRAVVARMQTDALQMNKEFDAARRRQAALVGVRKMIPTFKRADQILHES